MLMLIGSDGVAELENNQFTVHTAKLISDKSFYSLVGTWLIYAVMI